ncbi:hypothetical protein EI42_04914 [Thermosporothrix hazakensis]|jgi:cell division protein FtsB|uniref:Uncharacterized protein n=2 Tax=Thermosporothrix TaxID=768650 RepID=A0A326U1G7_THEHA|nr:hypothetical protein [Thermosporothrix hazakensis]PZW23531.1 hypothetical protein EI42_04914 [Thermosporothrix hazakensis]BBH86799.1 hypothetical protein KTC_15500 [Thermosporothrix sp. COM3]GCE51102.1 hypothetical protein KTH_59710 [Thermosporothrix hazakensis]
METVNTALSTVSILMTLCAVCGGFLAWRTGATRTANEVQQRVIDALNTELDTLRARLDTIAREKTRLEAVIAAICAAMRNRGMSVDIQGELVLIQDVQGGSIATRIQQIKE